MIGTYRPNVFHRLGDAWNAFKAIPVQPGLLYPPPRSMNAGPLTWPGWEAYEKQAQNEGARDLQRAKLAVTSPWVFADVQAIANEFSTSQLIVKERRGAKLEDVENHPLELIWESPNEHMGRSFVTAFWAWSYVLSSKAYLYWVPDASGTQLMEVWPIPPWMIRPVPDKDKFISGYAFKSSPDSNAILIPPELITYSHSVNLFDVRDGLSFLAAADTEIRADLAASVWNLNFFDDNNGVPDGLVSVGKDTLDQDLQLVRMEMRDFFGGTKRGIAVARSGDLDYKEFGRSQKDMEFSQGREFASKVIGRTLGFPDGYWSDLANRANAEQARRTMISGAVWPLLVRLAEDMNAQKRGVVQRWYGDGFRVEFKDIRPEDKEMKLRELTAFQPFITVNELREMIGQEPLEDVRGLMLVAEINKGAPLPGTEAAQQLEDAQAAKDEAAAQEAAATMVDDGSDMEEEAPPAEPPPQILGYHIEQGVVSRNEARERLALPPEDESKSQNLRDLQAMLAVVKMATDTGIDLVTAAGLVGLMLPETAPVEVAPPIDDAFPPVEDEPTEGEPMPDDIAPEEALPVEEEIPVKISAISDWEWNDGQAAREKRQWEAKALRDFERKGRVYRPFKSGFIPIPERAHIESALSSATDTASIKAAFKGVDALLDSVDADARKWVEEATQDG